MESHVPKSVYDFDTRAARDSRVPNNRPYTFILLVLFSGMYICLIWEYCFFLKFPCMFIYFWTFFPVFKVIHPKYYKHLKKGAH